MGRLGIVRRIQKLHMVCDDPAVSSEIGEHPPGPLEANLMERSHRPQGASRQPLRIVGGLLMATLLAAMPLFFFRSVATLTASQQQVRCSPPLPP